MNLKQLIDCLPFVTNEDLFNTNININDLQIDSRLVKENDLFICIKGFTVDGHDFVEEAIKNGAAAIVSEKPLNVSVPTIQVNDTTKALALLADRFFNSPTKDLNLIGITGTNGKTTITYILEEIFKKSNHKTGIIGTIQMKIKDKVYEIKNTTPDALTLQKSFSKMVKAKVDTAIMEVSSHALDLGRVFGTDFDVAVFTNLSQDHLDFHETMESYLQAKSLLFSQLGNSYSFDRRKFVILNKDDKSFDFLNKVTSQHVLSYGLKDNADIYATNIKLTMENTQFTAHTPVGSIHIKSNLVGKFNIYNILASIAVSISQNISLQTIKEAIESIRGISGRFEPIRLGQDYSVIVDFAHTDESLKNVLETVQDFVEKNIYVVVGCGGERDKKKRPLMAKVATDFATHAFFTSDNPRNESPKDILNDMISGLEKENYTVIIDREKAIKEAINKATTGDLVLIAGKGHETEQIIGNTTYAFDDRLVAQEAIQKKGI